MGSFRARCKKQLSHSNGKILFAVGNYYPAIEHRARTTEVWYRVYYGESHQEYIAFEVNEDSALEMPRLYEFFCTEAEERKAKIAVVVNSK